jgi:hypothetical protein
MMIENNHEYTLQGTADDIVQLAFATASDHGIVATLTVSNAELASQLEASQAYIKKINEEIVDLNTMMKPA